MLFSSHMVWSIIDGLLFVMIICGNVLTILAIRLSRRLRNITSNYFVLSLAISDFLVGLSLPYHLAFYVLDHLSHVKVACIARFVFITLACSASIYNLIAIAVDRYISIVHPMKYTRYMTWRVVYTIITIGWITAIGISTIPTYWNCFDNAGAICEMDTILPRYYTVAVLTPMLFLTWITMFVIYWRIWREASTHARRLRGNTLYNDSASDWKSVQVVLLVLGCFSVCWLPYLIVACTRAYEWQNKASPTLYKATFSLAMANSGMNPIIYAWKNANFRKAFNRLLHFESPNCNEFNSSLKNYLSKQKELRKKELGSIDPTIQTVENQGIKTICDNYSFEIEETATMTTV
ncbi:histamine H2 receptor-like [Diprion similis]|uniref:histamine H2 receptor-like n=1 Tax=Diprion similis TaxID=362088 RepID=UPI001EF976DD|nr:histamine H2 receptor-like [Diprion similis]XP_046737437.1 histamine H2 receptor-like [Diprion similis]XP_046737438.1 histamine H2 receptor-like [Diprion similis]XP_046737439.1 histamine H2 receptor-like [Diprion similis]XP_046737440.1 histamine H2 receptor-like [Diprion similis]